MLSVTKREKILLGVVAGLIVLGALLGSRGFFSGMEKLPRDGISRISPATGDPGEKQEEDEFMVIHVVGAVNSPGIYFLPPGSRVYDAVTKAGGAAPDARLELVNLARPLFDGEQVWIPVDGEEAFPGGSEPGSGGKININRASVQELVKLNNIGEKRAQAIIDYRESHGPFSRIEDIMNVPNIGAGIFESIKECITVY